MFKQSPRRAKNKGIKVKHVVQVGLLLGVGIWLLYQVQHSHDKKESMEESANTSGKIQTGNDMIKLGRKDLQPDQKDTTVEDERNKEENAAGKEQFEEENKPGEHVHDEVKGEDEGQNGEDSVNRQKETQDSSGKEVREEENKDGESGEESKGGKGKEAEEKESDDSKSAEENGIKEEEGVKSETEQSGEKDGEEKEKGSSEKENEIDAGGEEKENNENVIEDTKEKESEEGHVEVKDNKEEEASKNNDSEETIDNEIVETKENGSEENEPNKGNGSEETKENGSELDGGAEKEVKEDMTEENEKEDGKKNGEIGDKGSDSKQKEEKEEHALDVLSTATKESENTTETAEGTASNKDAREGENLEKMFSNVVANKGRRNVTYHVENGDSSNFTTGTTEGNQKQAEDTIYSSVTNGDGSQNVVKEPSENVYEKSDSDSAPPSTVKNNTTNQESVDEQNVDFSASGTTENGSENSSGSEGNHMDEQKDSNYSGTVAAEQFKPSHDSDKPDAGQSKPDYSSRTEEASSVSNDQADAGKQNHDASSGSSLLQEEKEARTDLGTLPETGTGGNGNEEAAAE